MASACRSARPARARSRPSRPTAPPCRSLPFRPVLRHLAWSTHDGRFLNDLLPLPYNRETLGRICAHVDEVQNWLGTRMLLENPATYVAFEASDMHEVEFLDMVADRTGCGLLLDINNVYVAAANHGFEPMAYIDAFPLHRAGEIHLAGFAEDRACQVRA